MEREYHGAPVMFSKVRAGVTRGLRARVYRSKESWRSDNYIYLVELIKARIKKGSYYWQWCSFLSPPLCFPLSAETDCLILSFFF